MANYRRIGNRTLTSTELQNLTAAQINKIKEDGERANQLRLENMRKGLGIEPQKVTLDVTPAGIAARKEAIAAEEARIAAETKTVEENLGAENATFTGEGEQVPDLPSTPAPEVKKSKAKNK